MFLPEVEDRDAVPNNSQRQTSDIYDLVSGFDSREGLTFSLRSETGAWSKFFFFSVSVSDFGSKEKSVVSLKPEIGRS